MVILAQRGTFIHLTNISQGSTLCQSLGYCMWLQGEQDRHSLSPWWYVHLGFSLVDAFVILLGTNSFSFCQIGWMIRDLWSNHWISNEQG